MSGLCGGISIAFALTLTQSMSRDPFIVIAYVVVIFSIVVRGLTICKVANKLMGDYKVAPREEGH